MAFTRAVLLALLIPALVPQVAVQTGMLTGRVTAISHANRDVTVELAGGHVTAIGYDVLVVAPGSVARTLPIPGLAEHGIGFKTIGEAIFLRNHVLERLDVAATTTDAQVRGRALTFVFVMVTWVFFRAGSLATAVAMLRAMIGANGTGSTRAWLEQLQQALARRHLCLTSCSPPLPSRQTE